MMTIKVVSDSISLQEVVALAEETYGEMVKAVVDIKREILAIGGELHADAESQLLNEGSQQPDLWGINIHPSKAENERIQYTSMINIRPRQGNRSLEIKDASLKAKIKTIINKRIKR